MIGTKGSPNRASKQRGSLIESQTRKHANHKANMWSKIHYSLILYLFNYHDLKVANNLFGKIFVTHCIKENLSSNQVTRLWLLCSSVLTCVECVKVYYPSQCQ